MIYEALKKKIGPALVATFLLFLALKDFLGIGIPSLAFTAVWILIIVFANHNIAAAFTLSVVICFSSTLSITIPTAFFILWTLINRGTKFKLNSIFWLSTYIALIEFFRLLFVAGESFKLYVNIMVVVFLVVTIVTEIYNEYFDPTMCLKFFIGFYLFLTLDIIWATARALGGFGEIINSGFRIGQVELADEEMVGLLGMNSNGIALFSILIVAFSIVLMNQKRMKIWVVVCLTVYATVIGLLTVSKTFILVYAGFWLLYVMWYVVKHSKNLFKSIGLISGIVVTILLTLQTTIVQNVLQRFLSGGDFTTGRLDILKDYLDYMQDSGYHTLIGIGLQNVKEKVGLERVPHNAIVELYVCLGIAGLILYALFFIFLIRMGIKYRKNNLEINNIFIAFVPLGVYAIFIQAIQFLRINYIYALIPLIFACMVTLTPRAQGKDIN